MNHAPDRDYLRNNHPEYVNMQGKMPQHPQPPFLSPFVSQVITPEQFFAYQGAQFSSLAIQGMNECPSQQKN